MKPYTIRTQTSEGFNYSQDVDDPFHTTTVNVAWSIKEWLKFFLTRELQVIVRLQAREIGAIQRVMTALHDDCSKCGTGDKSFHMDHVGEHREQYVGGESNG